MREKETIRLIITGVIAENIDTPVKAGEIVRSGKEVMEQVICKMTYEEFRNLKKKK